MAVYSYCQNILVSESELTPGYIDRAIQSIEESAYQIDLIRNSMKALNESALDPEQKWILSEASEEGIIGKIKGMLKKVKELAGKVINWFKEKLFGKKESKAEVKIADVEMTEEEAKKLEEKADVKVKKKKGAIPINKDGNSEEEESKDTEDSEESDSSEKSDEETEKSGGRFSNMKNFFSNKKNKNNADSNSSSSDKEESKDTESSSEKDADKEEEKRKAEQESREKAKHEKEVYEVFVQMQSLQSDLDHDFSVVVRKTCKVPTVDEFVATYSPLVERATKLTNSSWSKNGYKGVSEDDSIAEKYETEFKSILDGMDEAFESLGLNDTSQDVTIEGKDVNIAVLMIEGQYLPYEKHDAAQKLIDAVKIVQDATQKELDELDKIESNDDKRFNDTLKICSIYSKNMAQVLKKINEGYGVFRRESEKQGKSVWEHLNYKKTAKVKDTLSDLHITAVKWMKSLMNKTREKVSKTKDNDGDEYTSDSDEE